MITVKELRDIADDCYFRIGKFTGKSIFIEVLHDEATDGDIPESLLDKEVICLVPDSAGVISIEIK